MRTIVLWTLGLFGIFLLGSAVEGLFYHGFDEVMLTATVALALAIWLKHNVRKEPKHEQPVSQPERRQGERRTRH